MVAVSDTSPPSDVQCLQISPDLDYAQMVQSEITLELAVAATLHTKL